MLFAFDRDPAPDFPDGELVKMNKLDQGERRLFGVRRPELSPPFRIPVSRSKNHLHRLDDPYLRSPPHEFAEWRGQSKRERLRHRFKKSPGKRGDGIVQENRQARAWFQSSD
jgi:hypothetical protein